MIPFIRDNARWLAGGFLLTLISSFGQTFFIGLSGNDLRATFDLSDGAFGLLYMGATIASALTLPWLGRTLDVMPGWKVVRFSVPCLAASCLLMALAPHVLVLALSLYLLRLFGQGMMTHIALTETGRWFVANRGRAMSLVVPGHQLGEALLPVGFVLLSVIVGWRGAWVGAACVVLFVAYPALLQLLRVERMPRSQDLHARQSSGRDWTRGEVVRDPYFYLLLVGVLAPPFIGTTIFFHQGHLTELRGYDPLAFAAAFPLMAATTLAFALACGWLIDRFGALRLLPFLLIPLAFASAAVGLLTATWGIYVFMVLFGISYGVTSTLLGALWPEIYGLAHLGAIRAIIVSAMVLATAIGPGLTGALIDLGIALPQQLLWMGGWCIAASLALAVAAKAIRLRTASEAAGVRAGMA